MPATDIGGYGGNFAGPTGWNATFTEWSGTLEIDVVETPAGFGENWHGARLGAAKFLGSFNAKAKKDAASTNPIPIPTTSGATGSWATLGWEGTATLTADTGCTYTGTFIFYNVQIRRPHVGYVEISGSFRNKDNSFYCSAWDQT